MAAKKKKQSDVLVPKGYRLHPKHISEMDREQKKTGTSPSAIIRECLDKRYKKKGV